jgi:ubiquinone/menaquinone biosynthesis C-methylase UbiE
LLLYFEEIDTADTRALMSDKKSFEFDKNIAQQLNRLFSTDALKKLRREYFQMLGVQPGENVLDVGCGTAANAIALAKTLAGRCTIAGIDSSEPMLAIAQENLKAFNHRDSIKLVLSDAQHLKFPDNTFDAVIIIQVLEYSKDPIEMLTEALRVLKPGGRAFVADTDWDTIVWNSSMKERTRDIVRLWSDHEADGWQGRRIMEYLKRSGFNDVRGRVFAIQETSFKKNSYSRIVTEIVTEYLIRSAKMSEPEILEWISDLKKKDDEGHFYFFVGRFAFLGYK